MRVCASYGSVPDRLADADMHELRLDVFDVLPPDLDRDCIGTLAGKDISAVPAGFEGMVDVGDSDAEIPFRKIRSVHDFEKTPSEEVLRRTLETGDQELSKFACMVRSFSDLHTIYKAATSVGRKHLVLGMGEMGTVTRIRQGILGNDVSFGYVGRRTASGQLSAEEMKALGDDCAVVGITGNPLGHTLSPVMQGAAMRDKGINGIYLKFESPDLAHVDDVIREYDIRGMNVTIPYKRAVMEYLDELSPLAERMGNVNTITRLSDGRLRGDNTDYFGFQCLVEELGAEAAGKKALVLGATGGAGTTASMVLGDLGAIVAPVGRTSEVNYDNIAQQSDAALLVNCTPAGMFPHCPAAPCTLEGLDALEGVIDIVYNPARTGLMLAAERRGIPCIGGLLMLVAQAAQAVERYTGQVTPRERILDVTERLSRREQNIALIGMPGSGKTRVGEQIALLTGREHIDLDRALEERLGMPCADYIVERGEVAFREQETAALADISQRRGLVLSPGGGVVTRDENYPLLHQNSQIVMLNRKLDELAHKGRPITARDGIEKLAEQRMPRYRAWADHTIDSRDCAANTARAALDTLPPAL